MKKPKSIFEKHIIFLIFISLYLLVVIYPALKKVFGGELFGGDVGQYLISAYDIVHARDSIYRYPYPVLPLLYIPIVMLFTDPFIQYSIGCIIGPILLILLVAVTYLTLSSLYKDKRHHQITSILGCIPLAFYPLYFDAIGWGGQAQFLALILGMLMIKFYVERKFVFFMLTSIILILAHPWVASYFISIVLLDSIKPLFVKKQADVLRLRQISTLSFAKFALCPAIVLGLVYIFLEGKGLTILYGTSVMEAIINRSIDLDLFVKRLIYSTEIIFLLFFSAFLLLSLTILLIRGRNDVLQVTGSGNTWLISTTSIMTLVFIMLSPAQYADRGIYLLPIPIALCLSDLLSRSIDDKLMKCLISMEERGERNRFFTLLFSVLLFSVLLIGAYAGSTVIFYPIALDYYSIPNELFDLPYILKDVDGNVLFITPHALWFPASSILKTDVFVTTQPVWFIQNRQIHYVELANMLTWGNVFTRCGKVIVVDSEPLWTQPSPAIFVSDYPYFVELIRLSDGLLPVEWSPIDSPETIWSNIPSYSDSITSTWGIEQSHVYINHTYKWNSLTISKTTLLFGNSTIEIKLRYIFLDSVPRSVENQLIFLVMKNLGKDLFLDFVYYDTSRLAVKVTQRFREPWVTKKFITLINIHSENATIDHSRHEDAGSWSFLQILYRPYDINVSSIVITMKFSISLSRDQKYCNLELTTREDLIKQLNIEYIIVDKDAHEDSLHMVERDTGFYRCAEVGRLIIYCNNMVQEGFT